MLLRYLAKNGGIFMKRNPKTVTRLGVLAILLCCVLLLSSCSGLVLRSEKETACEHRWREATCQTPRTCKDCSETEGEALGHTGGSATCQQSAVCTRCHEAYGAPLSHSFSQATCVEKATCSACGETTGDVDLSKHVESVVWHKTAQTHVQSYSCCGVKTVAEEAHQMVNGSCSVCSYKPGIQIPEVVVGEEDRQISLIVSLGDNPGILGLELSVAYNETVMTLVRAENGSALTDLDFSAPSSLRSGCKFLWDGVEGSENEGGDLLILTFDIAENAPAGTYSVLLTTTAYDAELNLLPLALTNGTVVIE